jgi:hypothetical protein
MRSKASKGNVTSRGAALRNDKRKGRTTAKAKCGGLSTAQQTMRLSVAPVEMTSAFFEVGRKAKSKADPPPLAKDEKKTSKGKSNGNPPFAMKLQRMGHPAGVGGLPGW